MRIAGTGGPNTASQNNWHELCSNVGCIECETLGRMKGALLLSFALFFWRRQHNESGEARGKLAPDKSDVKKYKTKTTIVLNMK